MDAERERKKKLFFKTAVLDTGIMDQFQMQDRQAK